MQDENAAVFAQHQVHATYAIVNLGESCVSMVKIVLLRDEGIFAELHGVRVCTRGMADGWRTAPINGINRGEERTPQRVSQRRVRASSCMTSLKRDYPGIARTTPQDSKMVDATARLLRPLYCTGLPLIHRTAGDSSIDCSTTQYLSLRPTHSFCRIHNRFNVSIVCDCCK
ncbi:hypothetical protein F443_03238 [Phytophthora nicotianae P1569]|uniref:Uncharacterized protein n=1 Tax=Phytophthora nicotianae P1569 TaxID=1317065 RepID=V9FT31_PHYNI|nr:hypothetical protein F443_03238 [Phytophthora nicotianae P1569]